jgi:hypothetical protein
MCNTVIYALLDEQSNACFISESALSNISGTYLGKGTRLNLATIMGEDTIVCDKVDGLVVKGLTQDFEIELPSTYTRAEISAKHSQIPKVDTVKQWPHLVEIADRLAPYMKDTEIGLLIGTNCLRAIKPLEIVPGELDDPYGVRTALGWGVVGVMGRPECMSSCCDCHIVQISRFTFRTHAREVSPVEVAKMFEIEFSETATNSFDKLSLEDNLFLSVVTNGIQTLSDASALEN